MSSGRNTPGLAALLVFAAVAIMAAGGLVLASAASLSIGSQALTPYQTCTLTAATTTTTVVADSEVRQGTPTTNYGTQTTLNVTSSGTANRRVYIRFDLTACNPAIPSTATIRLATLRLYMTAVPAACRTLDVFRATASWVESTITWNNQPFGTTLNNPPTGSRTDSFNVGTPAGCQNQASPAYTVGNEPTADVAAWVAGTATNYGWMIRDDTEGSATARTVTFSAKNLGTLAQEPQLVITYVAVP
jgi:hypothetical protein